MGHITHQGLILASGRGGVKTFVEKKTPIVCPQVRERVDYYTNTMRPPDNVEKLGTPRSKRIQTKRQCALCEI